MQRKIIAVFLGVLFCGAAYAQVDYASEVQPIFNQHCTFCHGTTSGVTLNSYADAIASIGNQYGEAVITPGDTAASPLWDKISSTSPEKGGKMPPSGLIDETKRNTIAQWILEGANETPNSSVSFGGVQVTEFELISNYPNPFNPSTRIRFTVPIDAAVTLVVSNVQGQMVAYQHGHFTTGSHELLVRLENQPSGVYVARLMALNGNRVFESQALKMTLTQ